MDFSVSFHKVEYDPSEYITNSKIKIHKEAKLVNLQNIRSGGLVGCNDSTYDRLEYYREGSQYPRRYRHRFHREKYNNSKWRRYQSFYSRNRRNRTTQTVFASDLSNLDATKSVFLLAKIQSLDHAAQSKRCGSVIVCG